MTTKELNKEIISAEFEVFLSRCVTAGVPRQEAYNTISGVLAMEGLKRWSEMGRVQEEKAAQTPKGVLLQKAFDLWKENEELSRLGIKTDPASYREVCLEYLKTVHGAVPGDTVKVFGWAKARTIEIVDFELSYYSGDKPSEAFMFFRGPCIRNKPSKMTSDSHGCTLDSPVDIERRASSVKASPAPTDLAFRTIHCSPDRFEA